MHPNSITYLIISSAVFIFADPTCYVPAVAPKQGIACGVKGTFRNPAPLGPATTVSEDQCTQSCLQNPACKSFSYNRAVGAPTPCQQYTKKPANMGRRPASPGTMTYIWNRACFIPISGIRDLALGSLEGDPQDLRCNLVNWDVEIQMESSYVYCAGDGTVFLHLQSQEPEVFTLTQSDITVCPGDYTFTWQTQTYDANGTAGYKWTDQSTGETVASGTVHEFVNNFNDYDAYTSASSPPFTLPGYGPYTLTLFGGEIENGLSQNVDGSVRFAYLKFNPYSSDA